MTRKKSSNTQGISAHGEDIQENVLKLIYKIAKNTEEKILLEDSIKRIARETDIFVRYINEMDQEKRNELLEIYNKMLDGLKQRANTA
jgi:tRNA uridine 5-carbamoylmethylation protein Kti12